MISARHGQHTIIRIDGAGLWFGDGPYKSGHRTDPRSAWK